MCTLGDVGTPAVMQDLSHVPITDTPKTLCTRCIGAVTVMGLPVLARNAPM